MNIRVLLASSDKRYISQLMDTIERTPKSTEVGVEVALYTDEKALQASLGKPTKSKKPKYDIALVDEDMLDMVIDKISVVLIFTENSVIDGASYDGRSSIMYIDKYQRVSDINKKIFLSLAKVRREKGVGDGIVCAFFSPNGGGGASTLAAAFAKAGANAGIRPLFVSLESFNSTELFFSNTGNAIQGLYDIFYIMADGGSGTAAINAVKLKDDSGVSFIKKFPVWTEIFSEHRMK